MSDFAEIRLDMKSLHVADDYNDAHGLLAKYVPCYQSVVISLKRVLHLVPTRILQEHWAQFIYSVEQKNAAFVFFERNCSTVPILKFEIIKIYAKILIQNCYLCDYF
jgi:hypothetical protein